MNEVHCFGSPSITNPASMPIMAAPVTTATVTATRKRQILMTRTSVIAAIGIALATPAYAEYPAKSSTDYLSEAPVDAASSMFKMTCYPAKSSPYDVAFYPATKTGFITGAVTGRTREYSANDIENNTRKNIMYVAMRAPKQPRTVYLAFDYSDARANVSAIRVVEDSGRATSDKCSIVSNPYQLKTGASEGRQAYAKRRQPKVDEDMVESEDALRYGRRAMAHCVAGKIEKTGFMRQASADLILSHYGKLTAECYNESSFPTIFPKVGKDGESQRNVYTVIVIGALQCHFDVDPLTPMFEYGMKHEDSEAGNLQATCLDKTLSSAINPDEKSE